VTVDDAGSRERKIQLSQKRKLSSLGDLITICPRAIDDSHAVRFEMLEIVERVQNVTAAPTSIGGWAHPVEENGNANGLSGFEEMSVSVQLVKRDISASEFVEQRLEPARVFVIDGKRGLAGLLFTGGFRFGKLRGNRHSEQSRL